MRKEPSDEDMVAELKFARDNGDPELLAWAIESIRKKLQVRANNQPLRYIKYHMATLWFGFINEGDGIGSIVVFDKSTFSDPTDKYVCLFNFKRNEIIIYVKNIIRPRLRRLNSQEKSMQLTVTSAYLQASKMLEIERRAKELEWDNHELMAHELEIKNEIHDEAWGYAEDSYRSENEGWFYKNSEGSREENIVDHNYDEP